MKALCLWSGGKDSCFACYKAMAEGYKVSALLNFIHPAGENSLSHGLCSEIIFKQAEQTGIPMLQKTMHKQGYVDEFKALLSDWKIKDNIEGVIFGDIYLEEHRQWIDKVCAEAEVKAVFPLWRDEILPPPRRGQSLPLTRMGRDDGSENALTRQLLKEIIDSGFKAIVVSVNKDVLGREWLGRQVDREFVSDLNNPALARKGGIDPCGEKGEYHTFVYDGPIFKKPVEFITGRKILKDKRWFLELIPYCKRQ